MPGVTVWVKMWDILFVPISGMTLDRYYSQCDDSAAGYLERTDSQHMIAGSYFPKLKMSDDHSQHIVDVVNAVAYAFKVSPYAARDMEVVVRAYGSSYQLTYYWMEREEADGPMTTIVRRHGVEAVSDVDAFFS